MCIVETGLVAERTAEGEKLRTEAATFSDRMGWGEDRQSDCVIRQTQVEDAADSSFL